MVCWNGQLSGLRPLRDFEPHIDFKKPNAGEFVCAAMTSGPGNSFSVGTGRNSRDSCLARQSSFQPGRDGSARLRASSRETKMVRIADVRGAATRVRSIITQSRGKSGSDKTTAKGLVYQRGFWNWSTRVS